MTASEKPKAPDPTVQAAKRQIGSDEKAIVTLSTGVRARIRPVSAKLLDEIGRSVPEPPVPKQFIEAKQREEYNPLDPAYQIAIKEANHLRGLRSTEALVMFGVELVDAIPDRSEWEPKLRFMEKRGAIDLSGYDLDDPLECEFLYKTMIAVATPDLMVVSMASGLTEVEVADAMASFRRSKARRTDRPSRTVAPAVPRDNLLGEV
jgi:hypothetical protein